MNVSTHTVSVEELMAWLDGEAGDGQSDAIAAHAESCGECRQTAAALRSVSQQMAAWDAGSPTPEFDNRFERKAGDRVGRVVGKARMPRLLPRTRAGRWAAGLVSAGLVVAFLLRTPNRQMKTVSELRPDDRWISTDRNGPADRFSSARGRDSVDGGLASAGIDVVNGLPRSRAVGTFGKLQAPETAPAPAAPVAAEEPLIARTATLAIVVKQFDSVRASLDAILARHRGYWANLTVNTAEGSARSLNADLRIPAQELAVALADLKGLGQVQTETQSGEEVTKEHADLRARLRNSRETEERLRAILLQRSGKIGEVLAVEREIARVRGEIEQMEAEQKSLEQRVQFASIQLTLSEEFKAHLGSALPAIPVRLRNALVGGYRGAVESLVGIGLFAAGYGPSLLLWALILFFPVRAAWRRWKRSVAAA
ncbi:MAG TPA: DUF4349 domain-containing protein [Methylomirabilota bacterium]|nr:DUF4349 domain-containing protein [Methylomirabilota bacterium]